ncbi:hypothetical protein BST61_g9708 [Cercospora zeina]
MPFLPAESTSKWSLNAIREEEDMHSSTMPIRPETSIGKRSTPSMQGINTTIDAKSPLDSRVQNSKSNKIQPGLLDPCSQAPVPVFQTQRKRNEARRNLQIHGPRLVASAATIGMLVFNIVSAVGC